MCALVVLCSSTAALLDGQAVSGSLLGTVTDASGASVPNAKVVITERNTGISRSADTNQSGNYSFPNLEPGTYRVSVEQQGFRKAVKEGVDVLVNSSVRADLQLQPGAITETVNVVADVAILQTDRSDTGRKIETQQIEDLPLGFNRNFQSLIATVPGASRPFRPHSEFFNSEDSLSTHVNGQSRLGNNVQIEGIDDNHRTGLLTVLIPPIEALQTVDITTSNYEAELGRAGGAVENVMLKSGTNAIHGSAYEINKVSALGAKNFFATTKPVTTYNYYGGTIGGPIRKNRTFFFGDYLGIKDRRGDTNRATIPDLNFRSGNLSAAPTTIYDPRTGDPDGSNRMAFPGNVIPPDRISAISKRILALIPPPTNLAAAPGTVNWEKPTVRNKDTNSFDIKLDHQQTDKDRLAFRYSFQRPVVFDPPLFGAAGGGGKGFAGTGINRIQSTAINYDRIFSPTLIAEFRAGVSRYRNDATNTDTGTNASEAIGIKGANLGDTFSSGLSSIDITGFANPLVGYSASLPWKRAETNFNFVSNWTRILNNHTFKFGADLRRIRDDLLQNQTFDPRGTFRFRAGTTGLNCRPPCDSRTGFANAFASFLLDVPNFYGRDLPLIFPAYRQTQLFLYGQDKWQVSPKLTLDLGLRWEFYPPATPHHPGGFSNYDPSNNSLVLAGIGNNPSNLGRHTYWKDFAPRFGLAYRLNEKTVLRGGYGISYMPYPDNSYAYDFPVRQNNGYNSVNNSSFTQVLLPNGQPGSMSAGFPAPTPAVIPSNGIIQPAPLAQDYDVIPLNFHEGYVQSYNLAVQRQLPSSFVFEAAFVGNRGVRIPTVYNLNAGFITGAAAAGQPLFQKFGKTTAANLRFIGTSSNYNSLQVKFDRRFTGGFLLTTAYTYSKSIDSTNDNGGLKYYVNQSRNRARSDFDRTHMFVQSYIYQLPFGKGKRWLQSGVAGWIMGGWQVNGILTLMTGAPLNFDCGGCTGNTPGSGNSPDINGPLKVVHGIGSGAFWFDTSNFSTPAPGTFGNLGRNILSGPSFRELTASLFRRFAVTERTGLEFRAEAFNLTNTPPFNNPNVNISDGNFGHVTGSGDCGSSAGFCGGPRAIQFGMKLTF